MVSFKPQKFHDFKTTFLIWPRFILQSIMILNNQHWSGILISENLVCATVKWNKRLIWKAYSVKVFFYAWVRTPLLHAGYCEMKTNTRVLLRILPSVCSLFINIDWSFSVFYGTRTCIAKAYVNTLHKSADADPVWVELPSGQEILVINFYAVSSWVRPCLPNKNDGIVFN